MAGQESNVSTVQDGWRVSTLRALFTAHQVPRLAGLLDGQMDVFPLVKFRMVRVFRLRGHLFRASVAGRDRDSGVRRTSQARAEPQGGADRERDSAAVSG